jgi:hypothetical protein
MPGDPGSNPGGGSGSPPWGPHEAPRLTTAKPNSWPGKLWDNTT